MVVIERDIVPRDNAAADVTAREARLEQIVLECDRAVDLPMRRSPRTIEYRLVGIAGKSGHAPVGVREIQPMKVIDERMPVDGAVKRTRAIGNFDVHAIGLQRLEVDGRQQDVADVARRIARYELAARGIPGCTSINDGLRR